MRKMKNEIVPMNSELTEFDLQELEQRLETDPLAVGGILNLSATDDSSLLDVSANDCEHCSGWGACNFRGTGN